MVINFVGTDESLRSIDPSLYGQQSALSSPLSEPVTELGVEPAQAAFQLSYNSEDEGEDAPGDSSSAVYSTHATPAEDRPQSGEMAMPFECPHCAKTYDNEQSLKVS
jgi:hypothetical protein